MIFRHFHGNKRFLIIISFGVLLIGAGYFLQNKANTGSEPIFCTQDVKLCLDGSYVGRTGPKCDFRDCPDSISLPEGYALDGYIIEEVLNNSCVVHSGCETPGEYLVQSRCPFTSLCLDERCTVVCPGRLE